MEALLISITELQAKAAKLKELKQMKEEVKAEINALEDQIKAHMGDREEVAARQTHYNSLLIKSHNIQNITHIMKALDAAASADAILNAADESFYG